MKPIKLIALFICMGLASNAQSVKFETGLSLAELLHKARNENKYVFLDIFATWCGPCKMMDRSVYTTDSAGIYFNANFISAKVQMDKTAHDDEITKKSYSDAESINQKYKITAYPTFLFLSPEGNLVFRGSGYQSASSLIKMASEALDPSKNYLGLIDKFKKNKLSFPEMRALALKALKMQDTTVALSVAKRYKKNYLDHANEYQLLTRETMDFIREFPDLVTTKDDIFKLLYSKPSSVDIAANQDGLSKLFSNYVITREEINEKIWNKEQPKQINPNWEEYENAIAAKYTKAIAKSVIVDAKLRWYTYFKNWPEVVKYNIIYIESQPMELEKPINRVMLNNTIYDVIFKHSNDRVQLQKGINWMKELLRYEPGHYQWIDTYANLLYKSGEKEEAIGLEEEALKMAMSQNDKTSVDEYKNIIKKMKAGQQTW